MSIDMDEIIIRMKAGLFRKVYSEALKRYVYVLRSWVPKNIFKEHKKSFGYTDIGWTIKHPREFISIMMTNGYWELISNDDGDILVGFSYDDRKINLSNVELKTDIFD